MSAAGPNIKPKMKFKLRRMWADYDPKSPPDVAFQVYNRKSEGNVLELKQFPVLVLPADPESRLAIHRLFVDAFVGAEHGDIMAGIDAGLTALGFKTKGKRPCVFDCANE